MKQYQITENNIIYDIEEFRGAKYWRLNGLYHRENGPAVEYIDGHKLWYKNGKLHRDDGPAADWYYRSKEYWYDGKHLPHVNSNEELKRYIKLLTIS